MDGPTFPICERKAPASPARPHPKAKVIVFTDVGNTVVDRKDLWDMPIGFLLLIALVTSAWGYRKLRGLA